MTTIYSQIREIAKPIIQAYQTDVTVHDRRDVSKMVSGDTAVWAVRSHGSHLIHISMHGDAMTNATAESLCNGLKYFDAVTSVFVNEDGAPDWYFLEALARKGHGHVFKIDAQNARQFFVDRINAIESAIKKIVA